MRYIFFGEYSAATTSINALINITQKFKQTFKANEIDKEFVSQFLFAVNKRMQMWFESIARAGKVLELSHHFQVSGWGFHNLFI